MYKLREISLLVSCKKDSSVINKNSYRDELPFIWSLANSKVILQYYTASVVHEYRANAFSKEKGDLAVASLQ